MHFSIARVMDAWYVACRSEDLKERPVSHKLYSTPIVLFRDEHKKPVALLDRCAHRNVPLTLGWCEAGRLVCAYHGWSFDRTGTCQRVPALDGDPAGKARRVPRFETVEQQGFVWVYGVQDTQPKTQPFRFPRLEEPGYSTVRYDADCEGTLHANLENILDVPHTAFLHRGLFRGVERNEITAVVRRYRDRVEAEYVGEPVPKGVVGRILAPAGGTVNHFDRFFLPSIAQVEYQLGRNHLTVTSALTPISDFQVRLHAVITFRTVVPSALLKSVLVPIGKKILAQDQMMLKKQAETIQAFGGEQFVSTDVDILGPHIWRLLRSAERGELGQETETLDAQHETHAPGLAVSEERVKIYA